MGQNKFGALRLKTSHSLVDDDSENKKCKNQKTCVIKEKFKFEDDKSFLKAAQLENEKTTQKRY